jgi:hypothetical protein
MFLTSKSYNETVRRPLRLPRIFEYWHLLGLDAPSVAALWAWAFARESGLQLPPAALAILAMGTWLVYVSDRLLDALLEKEDLRKRHIFHKKHWQIFLAVAVLVLGAILYLAIYQMPHQAMREDAVLFAIAVIYFIGVHLRGRLHLPKEMIVGLIFALATAVPTWSRLDPSNTGSLIPVLAFALVAWLNCWAIEVWESATIDRRRLSAIVSNYSLGLAALLTVVAFYTSKQLVGIAATSAFLLYLLDRRRGHWATMTLRVAADAAMLTPLLLILVDYLSSRQ